MLSNYALTDSSLGMMYSTRTQSNPLTDLRAAEREHDTGDSDAVVYRIFYVETGTTETVGVSDSTVARTRAVGFSLPVSLFHQLLGGS